jgi:hypothetical protein
LQQQNKLWLTPATMLNWQDLTGTVLPPFNRLNHFVIYASASLQQLTGSLVPKRKGRRQKKLLSS